MRRRMGAGMQGRRGWRTGEVVLQWGVSRGWRGGCNPPCSVLVCAELHYTNSQIWFIRFDVDQSNKLVCVGNQTGEIFIWMLSGTEFVQVLLRSCPRSLALTPIAGRFVQLQEAPRVRAADGFGGDRYV